MFKKHMTPIGRNGTLHNPPGKGASDKALHGAASGGMPSSFQDYAKKTPMANPAPSEQPAPPPDGLGSGSFGGIGIA